MVRWQPDARGRLAQAAMELYLESGYEPTTVAAIAERAGLTERTFFRHFADKREILFGGSEHLQQLFVDTVAAASASATPFEVVTSALEAVAAFFSDLAHSRERQSVIDANDALQERELIKMARLSAAVAEALRARGVADPAAALAAEAGIAVFRVTFARWVADGNDRPFAELARESLAELRVVTGAP
jgi:AcrR family transcriptional regulator